MLNVSWNVELSPDVPWTYCFSMAPSTSFNVFSLCFSIYNIAHCPSWLFYTTILAHQYQGCESFPVLGRLLMKCDRLMVNGLHLYSAFIQSAVQCMPLIHPFTHQRWLAAMQGTNQFVRSNWGLSVLLRDTSTRPGWDRTGNPPTARRQLLPPEPYRQSNK